MKRFSFPQLPDLVCPSVSVLLLIGILACGIAPQTVAAQQREGKPLTTVKEGGVSYLKIFDTGAVAIGNGDVNEDGLDNFAAGSGDASAPGGATALGQTTDARGIGSTAIGTNALARGITSTAIGKDVVAYTDNSLSIGQWNSANTSKDSTLFVAGNGTDPEQGGSRSDALVLTKSGDLTIAGTLSESSDRRLKEDIEPLADDVLESLQNIQPVQFRFKDGNTHPSGQKIGLIAQEVQQEFPALVSTGSEGYLALAYPKLTTVLLKGIQEQQAQIERHEEQIAALQAENERIEKRLAALEAERTASVTASLFGPLGLVLLLGLGGVVGGVLWQYRS